MSASAAVRFSALPEHDKVLVVARTNGTIVSVLGSTQRVIGWHAGNLAGRALVETLIPESLRAQHLSGLAAFQKTGQANALGHSFATEVVGQAGDRYPVWLTVFGVTGGLMFGMIETRVTAKEKQ